MVTPAVKSPAARLAAMRSNVFSKIDARIECSSSERYCLLKVFLKLANATALSVLANVYAVADATQRVRMQSFIGRRGMCVVGCSLPLGLMTE